MGPVEAAPGLRLPAPSINTQNEDQDTEGGVLPALLKRGPGDHKDTKQGPQNHLEKGG